MGVAQGHSQFLAWMTKTENSGREAALWVVGGGRMSPLLKVLI